MLIVKVSNVKNELPSLIKITVNGSSKTQAIIK